MITKASECSIRVFMAAMFNQDYSGLDGGGQNEFDGIYTEYIDLSGIGETKEYELLRSIHNLECRAKYIKGMLDILYLFFATFSKPFPPSIADLVRYGHRIKWDPANPEDYLKQLDMVDTKEKKNKAELDSKQKELETLRTDGVKLDQNGRQEFIRSLNNLGRMHYQIDKDKTTVEELALMIKDYSEIIQAEAKKGQSKNDK